MENFFVVQCVKLRKHATIADTRTNTELSALSTVKPPSSMTALRSMCRRSLERVHGKMRITQANEKRVASGLRGTASGAASSKNLVPKMKDPSGGTTGRVKLYGRLGWMGARAEYSRWGGITAPT